MTSLHLDDLRKDAAYALLLSCCRVYASAADRSLQHRLAKELDNERFLALAERHLVGSLVWHNLNRHPQGTFDAGLMAALLSSHRQNVISEMVSAHAAVKLHRLLAGAGLPHCLLKGLAVGQRYYAAPGLRGTGDIDLLVPQASFDEVNRLLLNAGYAAPNPIDALTSRQRRYFMFQQNQVEFQAPGSGVIIELHWRLDQVPYTLAGLESAAPLAKVTIADARIACLDDEEMLLHLCVHGSKHAWFCLKWVFDLPNVLESREWDWPALRKKARSYRCEHALLLGLLVAEKLCGWVVPATVRPWLEQRGGLDRHFGLIVKAITHAEGWLNSPAGIVQRNLYAASFNDGLDCWTYQLATVATHRRDWELLPLPDALFPLYFALSPFTNIWHLAQRFRRFGQAPARLV